SALSQGRAGEVHGGDRLPWVPAGDSEPDNFAPLGSLDWQLHVYGEAPAGTAGVSSARALPLHVFRWSDTATEAGLVRNALYLIRPDGYVGLATERVSEVEGYLDAHGLRSVTSN